MEMVQGVLGVHALAGTGRIRISRPNVMLGENYVGYFEGGRRCACSAKRNGAAGMLSTSRRIISDRLSSIRAGGSPTMVHQAEVKSAWVIWASVSGPGGSVSYGMRRLPFGVQIVDQNGSLFDNLLLR